MQHRHSPKRNKTPSPKRQHKHADHGDVEGEQAHVSNEKQDNLPTNVKDELEEVFLQYMKEYGRQRVLRSNISTCLHEGHYNFSRARFKGHAFGSYLFERANIAPLCKIAIDNETGMLSLDRSVPSENKSAENKDDDEDQQLRHRTKATEASTNQRSPTNKKSPSKQKDQKQSKDKQREESEKDAGGEQVKTRKAESTSDVVAGENERYTEKHSGQKSPQKQKGGGQRRRTKKEKQLVKEDSDEGELKAEEEEEEDDGEWPTIANPMSVLGPLAPAELSKARRQFSSAVDLAIDIANSIRRLASLHKRFLQLRQGPTDVHS